MDTEIEVEKGSDETVLISLLRKLFKRGTNSDNKD